MPDFVLQRRLVRRFPRATAGGFPVGPVAGIDEAGRGPLAGPVVAAAVAFRTVRLPRSLRDGIDDSKRLSRDRREAMFAALQDL
ncbi:MAG: ribonuclease HII, partial [Alphaproteobacteria bacterium]